MPRNDLRDRALIALAWIRRHPRQAAGVGVGGFVALILFASCVAAIGGAGTADSDPSPRPVVATAATSTTPLATGTTSPATTPATTNPATTPTTTAPAVAVTDPAGATSPPGQVDPPRTQQAPPPPPPAPATTAAPPPADPDPVDVYYANCAEARAAGAAPLHRGEPGYRSGLDRDNDGTACDT
ncbi:excalibur calcium-binding domain-containing protein [Pseudofrankia sp. BMG5.37]|uniref:excalibur calcium-binding domain-containing protein n=1 Tax=Pseudofrankia sp. BMG5.37 TaxID=3050035 RepID=UPI00289397CD|nr:excalibur calcium-binding domain-containing protein [Pseudofrankia sp. BMG5.37]MDT3443592.1 excalibur calcium-binding domain-containing protein [Pseudofrankia sp. BMG5.37]